MNKIIIVFVFLLTSISHSQSNEIINIDSTQITLIGNKIYKAHQGYQKSKDSRYTTTFRYSEVDLGNVLFKTSKSELLPESNKALNALVILLRDNSQFNLRIAGHTDKIGRARKNLKLSVKRAKVVRQYLIRKGIKLDRIVANGYGDKSPICEPPCKDNRRVEFTLEQNGTERKLVTRLGEKKALAKKKKLANIKN